MIRRQCITCRVAVAICMILLPASNYGSICIAAAKFSASLAFVSPGYKPARFTIPRTSFSLHMSSVGGQDNEDNKFDDDDNPLNEWMKRRDTENVRQVREQFAEGRLPISYGAMNENDKNNAKTNNKFGPIKNSTATDAIDAASKPSETSSGLARGKANPYLNVVSSLTPSDLISRFTESASPRVQDAVRTTVLGLIGGLPQMAFDTKTIATGERLASLMFQLQMTGYMFKNAEYRSSLSQSLGRSDRMLPGQVAEDDDATKALEDGARLKGKIKVRYGGASSSSADKEEAEEDDTEEDTGESESKVEKETSSSSSPGLEVEVDAQTYMSELRGEVARLREELDATKQAKEEDIRKDLLMYIRTLPEQELRELTGTMSPEVLEAMKGLVTAVLAGIGEDEEGGEGTSLDDIAAGAAVRPNTVTEQSGEALAQLCMWQLVVGFNLRELEVREEFRSSMKNMLGEGGVDTSNDDTGEEEKGGVQTGPGAME